ncbi:MAG: hypothetical protein JO189_17330, partial [Deltaproteobacteria bacterium]|nr:hypothetical protein [Deltaproteobacteria bacterium]
MKNYQVVVRELMVVERTARWNPRVRRILKAAPLVVMFLLLHSRTARAACSFNPAPDPTADGAANSLRHAIQGANASGQDCTIQLQAGTYTLTIPNPASGQDNTAAYGDLDITDRGHTVTIQGKGAGVSIVNGNNIDRVFQVLGGANAAFKNLTIEGGNAQDDGTAGTLPGTTVSKGGGVLVQDGGHVTFSQVSVQGNQAVGGNGRNGTAGAPNGGSSQVGEGGGLFLSSGTVVLTDSEVSGNRAGGGTGGIGSNRVCRTHPNGGTVCSGNSGNGGAGAAGTGGGLYVLSGTLDLLRSTISDNFASGGGGGNGGYGHVSGPNTDFFDFRTGGNAGAGQGAGLFVGAGALQIVRSTISGNSAAGGMGGLGIGSANAEIGGSAAGGGLYVAHGNIILANNTLTTNIATGGLGGANPRCNCQAGPGGNAAGGGLYFNNGSISVVGATVAANSARAIANSSSGGGIANTGAGMFINTTLVGNNTVSFGNPDDVSGPITSAYSLISNTAGATITDRGGNLFNVNPLLDPNGLQFNGGPTQTVALQSGSPAIDAVPVAHCTDLATPPHPLTIDQRGLPRPDLGETSCDMGAFEVQDTIPFSHFSGTLLIDPDAGFFDLSGGFTLGTGGIFNPASNSVTFSVGSYSITAPAGRFVKYNTGYVYQGTFNGIFVCVFIKFTTTPGKYVLLATA